MRVERLVVQNLGPLESVDLTLKPVTVLMGPNEQGKSFLIDALGVLRFGTCRGVKVNENLALARNGSKGWSVEAELCVNPNADSLVLRRTRSTGPDAATLDGAMGDARVWRALLDGRQFLSMTPGERKALVADLLARDTADLVDVLVDKGAGPDVIEAVKGGDLRRAHRIATERRRALDRNLTEQETIAKAGAEDPEVPTRSGPRRISTLPLATIDDALKGARERWAKALQDAERAAHRKAIAEKMAAARKELEALGEPPKWSDEEAKRFPAVQRLVTEKREAHAAAVRESKALREQETALSARLKDAAATCPTCKRPLEAASRATLEKDLAALTVRVVEAGKAVTDASTALEAATKEAASLQERCTQFTADAAARKRLTERLKDAGAAEAAAAEPAPEDPTALEREVRRIESLRETRIRYDGRAEAIASAQGKVASLRAERDVAAEVEACCVPDRIDDEGAALQAINDACREFAPAIMGGPWVSVTATWDVTYAAFRVELASRSASIRTGLVLALALSRLSGVKCVFADDLESLDDSTRSRVVALLGALAEKGEIETAIVATVRKEPPAPAAVPSWLGRVWIEGGKARVV